MCLRARAFLSRLAVSPSHRHERNSESGVYVFDIRGGVRTNRGARARSSSTDQLAQPASLTAPRVPIIVEFVANLTAQEVTFRRVLLREQFAGAAKPGLNFVEDQHHVVAVGEVGNRVLSITFENFAAYGAAVDKMGEDKEVRAWQAKRMKAGYTTWVRSNMATEIEI